MVGRAFAIAAVLLLVTASAAQAFDARGSARQVYVTGLPANQSVTLLRPDGSTAKAKSANAQGGVLFRNVEPGSGYQVTAGGETSPPLTVISNAAAPPSTDFYDQEIPSS